MNFKDCLFGQIRLLKSFPKSQCIDLPNDLSDLITKQEVITWNNTSGMNPLCDYLPDHTVYKLSYGEMLSRTQTMEQTYLNDLTNGEILTSAQFEDLIKEDYSNEFTRICKRLGQWWHIQQFLHQRDALNFDYTILRQCDTLFKEDCNSETITEEIATRNQRVFGNSNPDIPVCYDMSLFMKRAHPSTTMVLSHAFILNRLAVEVLADNFYQLSLDEINYYYELLGADNFLNGDPGGVMVRLCIKQNVEPISISELLYRPEVCRGGNKGGLVDFSNIDRSGV